MKTILFLSLMMISSTLFASPEIVDTNESITEALVDFQNSATPATVNKFNGIKAWPVTGGVKVKVYVSGDSPVLYHCHRHHAQDPIECHLD